MTPEEIIERSQYEYGFDGHFFDRTLDGMTVPVVVVDASGTISYANFAASDLSGWSIEEGLGRNILEFVYPDDHEWVAETFLTLLSMDEGQTMLGSTVWSAIRFRLLTHEGEIIPVEVSGKVALGDGAVQGMALAIRDVRIETVGQRILQGIAVGEEIDPLMGELTDAIALPPADLVAAVYRSRGRDDLELIHTTDPALGAIPLNDDAIGSLVPTLGPITRLPSAELPIAGTGLLDAGFEEFLHVGVMSPDEAVTYRFVAASRLYLPAGRAGLHRLEWTHELANLLLVYDRANRVLKHEAIMDPLTGLRNRRGLSSYLEQLPDDQTCYVLFIDLDDFKEINDAHGHQLGDRTLAVVAGRIRHAVRLDDVVCRFGGDEFAIVLTPADPTRHEPLTQSAAEQVAERIVEAINEPIFTDGKVIKLSASIGVARSATPLDPERFFQTADRAMYEAKRAGGGRYAVAADPGSDDS